jgi:hypothetical protein
MPADTFEVRRGDKWNLANHWLEARAAPLATSMWLGLGHAMRAMPHAQRATIEVAASSAQGRPEHRLCSGV